MHGRDRSQYFVVCGNMSWHLWWQSESFRVKALLYILFRGEQEVCAQLQYAFQLQTALEDCIKRERSNVSATFLSNETSPLSHANSLCAARYVLVLRSSSPDMSVLMHSLFSALITARWFSFVA